MPFEFFQCPLHGVVSLSKDCCPKRLPNEPWSFWLNRRIDAFCEEYGEGEREWAKERLHYDDEPPILVGGDRDLYPKPDVGNWVGRSKTPPS